MITTAPSVTSVTPSHNERELEISGMTCAACVRHVEKALRSVPGVESAEVNLVTRKARVASRSSVPVEGLIKAVVNAGYGATAPSRGNGASLEAREVAEGGLARRHFIVAAVLTAPLLVLGMSHGAIPWAETQSGRWLQLALATLVIAWPGRRFFRGAWGALKHRAADMNTLVALGTGSAWAYSAVTVMAPGTFPHAEHGAVPHLYFEAASAIIAFVLLGKLLETRSRKRLSEAVRRLLGMQPNTARLAETGAEVPVEKLVAGDVVRVRPGERVPVDARIMEGASAIDESMLTGESIPADKAAGDDVFAGTLNRTGAITLRVTREASESALARIAAAVEEAQGSKAPIARLADVVSSYFVPVVLGIAAIAFAGWYALDPSTVGFATAIERFVAVLVIACPCALGLATPAAVAVATGRAAELGILIKGGGPLEAASRVDTVLFDKTGTLTRGEPELTDVIVAEGVDEAELLRLVGSAERDSEHPVARALVEGARARRLDLVRASEVEVAAGFGLSARVTERRIRVGTRAYLERSGVDASVLEPDAKRLAALGRTPIFVAIDDSLAGLIGVADQPTGAAVEVVSALREAGVDVAVVSGDRTATAKAVADRLGITRVIAEVRPEDKAAIVAAERQRGRHVAMVGDGINDAPALAAADVGIAVGHGTDIAIAAADVALLRDGVARLPTMLSLARTTLRIIKQNLFWAFVYNVVGIPIAAGALYAWTGWLLSPILASAAMSLSSVSVLTNSLRLRRFGETRGLSS